MWTYRVDDRTHYKGPLRVNPTGGTIFVVMDANGVDYTYFISAETARRVCGSGNT